MNDILFGNNNKAVIKKLANRSFHSNKMRNVIAAIAIALTTFLFTAVLTIGMWFQTGMENRCPTRSLSGFGSILLRGRSRSGAIIGMKMEKE